MTSRDELLSVREPDLALGLPGFAAKWLRGDYFNFDVRSSWQPTPE